MKRAERIKQAKQKLKELEPYVKKYEEAEMELKRAEESFDIGEKVKFEETCRRGCCIEFSGIGHIVEITKNGNYVVRLINEGSVITTGWNYTLERL